MPLKNVYERIYKSNKQNSEILINETERAHAKNKEDQGNIIKMASFQEKDADPLRIATIEAELRQSLLSVAFKLLTNQHLTLDQLSKKNKTCGTPMTTPISTNF